MNKLRLNAILFTLLALPASAVLAGNYYIGLGAGEADYQNWNNWDGPASGRYDDSDTGWKLFGGYQFSQYWGVEAAYVDLGEASVNFGPNNTGTMEADGYSLVGTATYPISPKFSVFANAGIFIWDADYNEPGFSIGDDGTDLTYGVGAQYHLSNRVSFRAEWTRYDDAGMDFTLFGDANTQDVDLLSLGVAVSF